MRSPSPSPFVSFARTLDELKSEFVSDIQRRLHMLDWEIKETKTASRSAQLATARRELEILAEYWQRVAVSPGRSRPSRAKTPPATPPMSVVS